MHPGPSQGRTLSSAFFKFKREHERDRDGWDQDFFSLWLLNISPDDIIPYFSFIAPCLKRNASPLHASESERTVIIYDVLRCYHMRPQDCLGIQSSSRQEEAACGRVNFLLHRKVLYEISAFGLQDSAMKVGIENKIKKRIFLCHHHT